MVPDRRGSVIVVDDEPQVRRLLTRILGEEGFSATPAACGAEALALLVDPADIVVLDMRLPDLSGPDVARQLRRRWPDLPILFISGYPEPALHAREAEVLVQHFLSKPFTREQLLEAVLRLVPASQGVPQPDASGSTGGSETPNACRRA
jgi:two-component system, cell cycle sensor histidine kinase and response regulator CckA